jgi:hypothetical protein
MKSWKALVAQSHLSSWLPTMAQTAKKPSVAMTFLCCGESAVKVFVV